MTCLWIKNWMCDSQDYRLHGVISDLHLKCVTLRFGAIVSLFECRRILHWGIWLWSWSAWFHRSPPCRRCHSRLACRRQPEKDTGLCEKRIWYIVGAEWLTLATQNKTMTGRRVLTITKLNFTVNLSFYSFKKKGPRQVIFKARCFWNSWNSPSHI